MVFEAISELIFFEFKVNEIIRTSLGIQYKILAATRVPIPLIAAINYSHMKCVVSIV